MSKRCPACGFVNDNSRIYCGSCGEPLDAQLRLMKDLNNQATGEKKPTYKEPPARHDPTSRAFRSEFDDDVMPQKLAQKKKSSAAPWLILCAILVILGILIVKYAL